MPGKFTRYLRMAAVCVAGAQFCLGQQTSKVVLDVNETLFSVATAINNCGYDADLKDSDPVRAQVRSEVARALTASPEAQTASQEMCSFYRDHQQPDPARNLAQYVSLGLNLGDPPKFEAKVKEADLPPDASYVLGFIPLLTHFYQAAGIHTIWEQHQPQYEELIEREHSAVTNMLLSTDVYLRLPISGYVGRQFTIFLEPMTAPGQINARNYGADYFLVTAPEAGALKMDQLRHTYLHFVLDPLMLKRGTALQRLEPLLKSVQVAPLDASFKRDISLLVTECLIQALEAHLAHPGKNAEPARQHAVDAAMGEGYILARYFYEALAKFETEPMGLQDALPDWLFLMDVDREKKRAAEVQFASQAEPEVVSMVRPKAGMLDLAEQRMASGDYSGARKLAQQALDEKQDPGRALFILAQAASLNKDMEGARSYFERTIQVATDARLVAWSHIYLGRISDMFSDRETALKHYRAALAAGETAPAVKAAAESGLKQPYEPKVPKQ